MAAEAGDEAGGDEARSKRKRRVRGEKKAKQPRKLTAYTLFIKEQARARKEEAEEETKEAAEEEADAEHAHPEVSVSAHVADIFVYVKVMPPPCCLRSQSPALLCVVTASLTSRCDGRSFSSMPTRTTAASWMQTRCSTWSTSTI